MIDRRHRLTGRLRLDAVSADDVDEHFAILSDPGVWRHLPADVHASRERTAEGIAVQVECWERTGLGMWTARLRTDLPAERVPDGLAPGAVVGMGGCAVPRDACAERSGLTLVWRGPDAGSSVIIGEWLPTRRRRPTTCR